jgi:translation elongation factor EF-1beta
MVFSQVHEKEECWYEMYRYAEKPPLISLSQLRLAVVNTDDEGFPDRVERALRFVHKIEAALNIKTCAKAYEVKNHPRAFGEHKVFLYIGHGDWMLSGPMTSLFTLALRIGFDAIDDQPFEATIEAIRSGERATYTGLDTKIVKTASHGIKRLREEGHRKVFYTDPRANYPQSIAGSAATHSAFGIAGFSAGQAKEHIGFWYPKDWTEPPDRDYQ